MESNPASSTVMSGQGTYVTASTFEWWDWW